MDWREQLANAISLARRSDGDDAALAALTELVGELTNEQDVGPLRPPIAILGLQGCAAGWVGVVVRPSGQTTLHVGGTVVGLVEQVREQEELGVIGICTRTGRETEVHGWMETHPSVEVIEIDPQQALGGQDPRQHLAAAGMSVPPMYAGMGFDEPELIEACVAASAVASRFR